MKVLKRFMTAPAAAVLIVFCFSLVSIIRADDEPWVLLFRFLDNIVNVVYQCVITYLNVFQACWQATGDWLVEMIVAYFGLLESLIRWMLVWPTNLILACAVNCALFWAWCIIRTIWPCGQRQPQTLPMYSSLVFNNVTPDEKV